MAILVPGNSKATPNKGIKYILNPEKCEGWDCLNLDDSCGVDHNALSRQMMETQHLYGKGKSVNERKYYHYKLSFHPDDRSENGGSLDTEKALEFAKEYAEKNWPGREVVFSIHADGEARHIHFIINAVSLEDGKKLDVSDQQYRAWKDACEIQCKEYGLIPGNWREATKEKRARESRPAMPIVETKAEQGLKSRGQATWKDELRSIIDDATATACDMEEFREILAEKEVTLTRCTDQTISYKLGDHRACRGDKLGGDYTVTAIRDVLERNAAALPQLPEGRKESLMAQLESAKARTGGGRKVEAEERQMWRDLGRMYGVRRSEVDSFCDIAASRANNLKNQKLYAANFYQTQPLFWDSYAEAKNQINQRLDRRYEALRKVKEIEWLLDPRNYRATFFDMLLAMIILVLRKDDIAMLLAEVEDLKMARSNLYLQMQEYRQASKEAKEKLLDNDKPKEDYIKAYKKMQAKAEQMCSLNLEIQQQRDHRAKNYDWER